MMNHWKRIATGLLCVASLPLLSQNGSPAKPAAAPTQETEAADKNAMHQTNGQRKFEQQCSRCHNAPEGFPPHISGTIVRHMRVRAQLSKQDEEDILRFLNP
jgi:cytochrome c5